MQLFAIFCFAEISGLKLVRRDSPLSVDNRVPFPQDLDWDRLFCFGDSVPVAPVAIAAQLAVKSATSFVEVGCMEDTHCASATVFTPFCVGGTCSECRSVTDCPSSTAPATFCSDATGNTCSVCETDSDCGPQQMCRFVADLNVVRKRCLASCPAAPLAAIMTSTSSCTWTCPPGMDGQCNACPVCAPSEMLVPGDEFGLSQPNFFYPTCALSTAPKCMACPGADNRCAVSANGSSGPGVGMLPSQYPCPAFTCKPDWYLDTSIGQCRACNYRSCPYGQYLSGCGLGSSGTCIDCQANSGVLPSTSFIQPQDLRYTVTAPSDVCKPVCPGSQRLFRPYTNFPWTCIDCVGNCPLGSVYSGCGPDQTDGACMACAMAPPPGAFWSSAGGCQIQPCQPGICVPGTQLVGCGGSQAGSCQPCPTALPNNALGFISQLDLVTMTPNTCAVQCQDGYYLDHGTCTSCGSCELGKQLVGCGDNSSGSCVDCPPIDPEQYFLSPASCASARCASLPPCGSGQYRAGCGPLSMGSCVSCGAELPTGAVGWVASGYNSCAVACADGYNLISGSCVSCVSLGSQCATGQFLAGCGPTSPGACTACPVIPDDSYWSQSACIVSHCADRNCGPAAFAQDCGQTNPGVCTSCGAVPTNANSWNVVSNECVAQCLPDFFGTKTCAPCNTCPSGQYLAGCGQTQPGTCQPCACPESIGCPACLVTA